MTLKQNCVKTDLAIHQKENKLILSWYNSEGKGIAKTSEARIKTFMDLYHKAELESIFMLPFQKENLNQ